MNRLLVWRKDCDASGRYRVTGRRALHIRDVLHAEPGSELKAGFLNEGAAVAKVLRIGEGECDVELRDDPATTLPPAPTVDLLLAMPRPRFLERILPQIATLGVRRLILTNADKVEPYYFATHLFRGDNLFPLLLEGLEQTHDVHVPEVVVWNQHYRKRWFEDLAPAYAPGRMLLAHPGGISGPDAVPRGTEPMLLAIGAEGGWSDAEVAAFESIGFVKFSVGGRILRTDTACVGVMSIVNFLRETRSP